MTMDLECLNQDLQGLGPLPAARIEQVRRTYFAVPCYSPAISFFYSIRNALGQLPDGNIEFSVEDIKPSLRKYDAYSIVRHLKNREGVEYLGGRGLRAAFRLK